MGHENYLFLINLLNLSKVFFFFFGYKLAKFSMLYVEIFFAIKKNKLIINSHGSWHSLIPKPLILCMNKGY
jgi:hypothetical protein